MVTTKTRFMSRLPPRLLLARIPRVGQTIGLCRLSSARGRAFGAGTGSKNRSAGLQSCVRPSEAWKPPRAGLEARATVFHRVLRAAGPYPTDHTNRSSVLLSHN